MIKKLYLPFLMALVVAFSSCSNKMGELSSDYFTVTPQVLEAVGGKVPATITGTFPEKYFKKNAVVTVTPVLKWDGGQAVGQSATFQGEKVEGNDQTISYKLGGTYTMRTVFDYVPEMAKSELYLQFDAKVGSKTVNIPEVKVADGVISTSELINNTLASANPANGDDAFQRIVKDKYEENIMFLIQQYNIGSKELKNATAFNKEVANVNAADNKQITNVEISAYASPDGGYDLNNTLSDNRMKATSNVVNKNLKKSKIDAAVDTKYTAQDWEGFQELVSKSNLQDKEVILRVLSMYSDPEQRETEIKNMSNVYGDLASDILPQLRRSRLTLNYEIIGKSDEEIAALASSDPKSLNVEELLYAATLTDDAAKKEAIYAKVAELYPNDYRGFNNLGKLAYEAGNIDKAESYFKKAAAVSSTPEVNNNLGLVALAKGDKTAAEQYLSNASGSKELNEALGNLYTAQGQYDRAVNAFGDTATNSAALAQILAKDYNKANTTLSSITNKDAYTYYLSSVLGARTNNTSMLTENLKKAVSLDSTLAKKAATDLEFSKYFTNSAFTSIIK
jgi:Flp pilus assembly protein TadD